MEIIEKDRQNSKKVMNITGSMIIIFISFGVSIETLFNFNNLRPGLEGLFFLPFSFAICHFLIPNLKNIAKAGFGIKIFYSIAVIRYVAVPLLISLTNGAYNTLPNTMPMMDSSVEGYQFSVIVSVIELFVAFYAINHYSKREEIRIAKRYKKIEERNKVISYNLGVSVGGVVGIGIFTSILLTRNIDTLFSTFSFLTIVEKYIDAKSDAFGIISILTLKSFVFLMILTTCIKKYQKKGSMRWVLIATIAGFLNLSIFFGYNRSLVLQTAIATIYTLYLSFPKYRKLLVGLLVPTVSSIMISMIYIKQFGVSYSDTRLSDNLNLAQLSNTIECYVSGPWSLASGYDAAKALGGMYPVETFIVDLLSNSFFSYLPGLTGLLELFPAIPSSATLHQVYTNSAQMIPLSAQSAFYVGTYFAPIISSFFIVLFMKILVYCDFRGKYSFDASKKYTYTLISVLLSFTMCYTWVTILWCFTKSMVFLLLMININEYHLKDKKIIRMRTM